MTFKTDNPCNEIKINGYYALKGKRKTVFKRTWEYL